MQLTENVYFYENVIGKDTCNKIINLSNGQWKEGVIGYNKETTNKIKRQSSIYWVEQQWVFNLVRQYIIQANIDAGWNFDISYMPPFQLTKYDKGDFYDYHVDGFSTVPYNREDLGEANGKVRKLSFSLLLNDTYEGGELEIGILGQKYLDSIPNLTSDMPEFTFNEVTKKPGSIIIFPSFLWHRVKLITNGNRYSLVGWAMGPPFK